MILAFKKRRHILAKPLSFLFGEYTHVELILYGNKSFSSRVGTGVTVEYVDFNNIDWDFICIGYALHVNTVENLIKDCKEHAFDTQASLYDVLDVGTSASAKAVERVLHETLPHIPHLGTDGFHATPDNISTAFLNMHFKKCLFGNIYNI